MLRGGLTPKFVDVPELLRTVYFEAVGVPMLHPETTMLGQELFRPPFREFQLQRDRAGARRGPVPLAQAGAAVIIVVSGSVLLDSPKGELRLERGGSAFLPAAEAPVNAHAVSGATGTALAFAVTTVPERPEPVDHFLQSPPWADVPALPWPDRAPAVRAPAGASWPLRKATLQGSCSTPPTVRWPLPSPRSTPRWRHWRTWPAAAGPCLSGLSP